MINFNENGNEKTDHINKTQIDQDVYIDVEIYKI